ncbi:MFS general substrate transporter [Daldinia decipiens]|uniref:MFS general substrate transporter n=1 Tax=Daldinia decipiens TaxID=326647 RepID=UPI0020C2A349|nr:MFS general substrate transporter [Daldinia decipiens]KAI1662017.1 MFS general substrate transporter [Daldinia decipiens]
MATSDGNVSGQEEGNTSQEERVEKDLHSAAEKGVAATDSRGVSVTEFDREAERRLRNKIDCMIVPTVSILYLFCFIDRSNIGNARLAGLEEDLGMKGNDYNMLLSIFYISYCLFEIPSNLACKWLGPGWVIPILCLGFGISSLGMAFVRDLPTACGVRFLLGVFEAGMMPGMSYYLSRWYRRSELVFRISLFVVMAPLAGAFGGLIASGLLSLSNIGSVIAWRMIFLVEGIITVGLSLISFVTLTDRPETARWLTEEEKTLAVARVKSERLAQTVVLDKTDRKKLWLGFWNPVVLSTSFIFLLNNITVQGLAFFTPTIVATIYPHYTTVQKQLYTVPPYVVGAAFELVIPLLSWRMDKRQVFLILTAPLTMMGYIMFLASTDPKVRYAATFFTAVSCFAVGALSNAQVAAQVVSDTARSVSLGTNMTFGALGGLIATWSYLSWDGPDYPIGNGLNLAASGTLLIVSTVTLFWMKADNKRREKLDIGKELEGLSQAQIESLEWKHPGWRWKP